MQFPEFACSLLARMLFRIGERTTGRTIGRLDNAVNYLEVGRWFKANGYSFRNSPLFADRYALYAAIARKIGNEEVLYLEFGVWQGASLRAWSKLLRNPRASLHGFDSFEGLPEPWSVFPKGSFDLSGVQPRFNDPRIVIHSGWFHDTLPGFAPQEHDRLVLNLDADLYSSTKYVLGMMRGAIAPGTIIIFDELHDRFHELKAFEEFLETGQMRFRFLGGTFDHGFRVALERVE